MGRVNHNAQYIYDFQGETPWEKLRAIRAQLKQRKVALEMANLNKEKNETKLDKSSFEYKEYLINLPTIDENIQDCINEIEFLTDFEKALAEEAEKTRISGKTDDEMYEINFFHELDLRLLRAAQSQILSTGRVSEETASRLLKNKSALQLCINQGLLSENAMQIAGNNLTALPNNYEIIYLENLKKEN